MADKKDIQDKYMKYQMLAQQLKQLQEQIESLDSQGKELNSTADSVADLSETKPGTTALLPLSNGIFAKGEIKEVNELIVNVGAGVAVKKTAEETKELISLQIKELNEVREKLTEHLQLTALKAKSIEKELQSLL